MRSRRQILSVFLGAPVALVLGRRAAFAQIADATLLVRANEPCTVNVDGEDAGSIATTCGMLKLPATRGSHIVQCRTADGRSASTTVTLTDPRQYIVTLSISSRCGGCSGKGRVPGTRSCGDCGGTGKVRRRGDSCEACDGRGSLPAKVKCSTCNGRGERSCHVCHGGGVYCSSWGGCQPCPGCGGAGRVRCYGCHGSGQQNGKKSCASCSGRGYNLREVKCDECDGKGRRAVEERCEACQGAGRVVVGACE